MQSARVVLKYLLQCISDEANLILTIYLCKTLLVYHFLIRVPSCVEIFASFCDLSFWYPEITVEAEHRETKTGAHMN